ncbi:scaffolding protein [Microbacterium phage Gretchen]|nr:scaffolding protein [Microbacterium phage Gretchen]
MSDAQPTDATTTPAEPSKETAEQTPPWGDDFDPARAWKALTAARDAEKAAKAEVAAYKKAEQEKADAEKTELERLRDQLNAATAEKTALARTAQLNELGLDKALHGFISGETPEAIAEQVAALKTALGHDKDAEGEKPAESATTRPQPKLTPGQGGDDTDEPDLDALVASLR